MILFLFSVIFYIFASVDFIFILLVSILTNYLLTIILTKAKEKFRTQIFILGVFFNLGLFVYFKYLGFLSGDVLNPLLRFFRIDVIDVPKILIPLGLSFYTFHALSYLIDVYRRSIKPTTNLSKLGVYFMMFPHMIAGPIVRYGEISQYLSDRKITLDGFGKGTERFITGLAKKVLIADNLGVVPNEIFSIPPSHMNIETAWLGIIYFTFQIYIDFSAYSDMAIGLALMLGFTFPENFNYPYISRSISEFWQRWHMTLYRWFRDYIYIPLGGNRRSAPRNFLNIGLVFLLAGLWHGASWHFMAWGLLQAVFLILERINGGNWLKSLWRPLAHFYTMLAISISWVIFRSESIDYAISYLNRMFLDLSPSVLEYRPMEFFLTSERILALVIAIILSTSMLKRLYLPKLNQQVFLSSKLVYLVIILAISIIYIADQTYKPFIYFKF